MGIPAAVAVVLVIALSVFPGSFAAGGFAWEELDLTAGKRPDPRCLTRQDNVYS
jgi:hypothetical protein